MKYPVAVSVNGRAYRREVEARTLLVDFLRDHLGLFGTHVGCETSQCGACLVTLDGLTLKACTRLAVQADGAQVTTLEGLLVDGNLHPVQSALLKECALTCGFCASGVVLAAKECLERKPVAGEDEVRRSLEGVFCRCTGYQPIVDAVRSLAAAPVRDLRDGATAEL